MNTWDNKAPDATYTHAEAEARLAQELPGWSLTDNALQHHYRTRGWQTTLLLVNAVGHLAEAAFHHPELSVSYGELVVRLSTHSAGGITHRDFALATKIEQTLCWNPAEETAGVLEGPPQALLKED